MLERRLLVKYGGAFGADIDRLLKKVKGKRGSKPYICDKCGEPTDKIYGGPGDDLCKECAKNAPKEPYKGYNRGELPPTGLTAEQEDQMLEEGLERSREGREPDIEPDFDAMKDDKE
jgi:ribosomal protein L37AE/L43A